MNPVQHNDYYIFPGKAEKKLKTAKKERMPVYLYGATGTGKTSLIRQFFSHRKYEYYEAAEFCIQKKQLFRGETEKPRIVVLDGLHEIQDPEDRNFLASLLRKLLDSRQIWLILISRAQVPGWLMNLYIQYAFLVISEQDFYLNRKEQDIYLEQMGIHASQAELDRMWDCTGGVPVAARLLALNQGDIEITRKELFQYLDSHVYDHLDLELEQFLMATSVVDSFTKELAEMITGNSQVETILVRAAEAGSFFAVAGKNGVWEYRWQMLVSMRQRLQIKYCKEKIGQYYHHAGLYYEMHDQIPEALLMYRQISDNESISRVLAANLRKNPATGHYYELKEYYLKLPEETVKESPLLIAGMSMLQSMLMNEEESERWYRELEEYVRNHTGSERREAQSRLLYLDIGLPHRGSVHLADMLKGAGALLMERKVCLPEFSVTSNLPSLMNGGKDFCEWSRHDRELAASIGKIVSLVLGKYGKGLVPLALAESFLEKGLDGYEVMRLIQKGKMEADSGGKTEQSFVAVGLLSWLAILDGNEQYALELIEMFLPEAEKNAPNIMKNLDAFRCRIWMYQNECDRIYQWMETAPNEMEGFATMERFRFLTKMRVYLIQANYEKACVLGEMLLYYADKMKRPYIRMETRVLLSIAQHALCLEEWKETLQACIEEAESYRFVRVLSREGTVLNGMLKNTPFVFRNKKYEKQVKEECRKMSVQYPNYLKCCNSGNIQLSSNAREILKLQVDGLSNREIAETLGLTLANVKYHSGETYRKLGVKSRLAAVNEAKRRNLI